MSDDPGNWICIVLNIKRILNTYLEMWIRIRDLFKMFRNKIMYSYSLSNVITRHYVNSHLRRDCRSTVGLRKHVERKKRRVAHSYRSRVL